MAKINHKLFRNPLPKQLWDAFFQLGFNDGDIKDDVVGSGEQSVSAKKLKPSQKEVFLAKSIDMAISGIKGGDLGSIVSHDNFILDGHHRWAATILNDPNASITAIKVALDIDDLIPVLRAAGDAFGNSRRGAPSGDLNVFTANIKDAMDIIENGSKDMRNWTKESAYVWLDKIGGLKEFEKRFMMLKNSEFPKNAPARKDMPVIDDKKGQEKIISTYLREGRMDIFEPFTDPSYGLKNRRPLKGIRKEVARRAGMNRGKRPSR